MVFALLIASAAAGYVWRCDLLGVCNQMDVSTPEFLTQQDKEAEKQDDVEQTSEESTNVSIEAQTIESVTSVHKDRIDSEFTTSDEVEAPSNSDSEILSEEESAQEKTTEQLSLTEEDDKKNKITVYFDTNSSELNMTEEQEEQIKAAIQSHRKDTE